ncbi:MAG: hypothetical protein JWO57_3355 [Pseudonocardiales bacterium]|nr:hypothetical protein [Pseudonocardiales bacterium]
MGAVESGWRARWQARVVQRSAGVALAAVPVPLRVLDVGCGTGALVRELATRLPNVLELVGVDPAEGMVRVARAESDGRARFVRASAEGLPFDDARFDLVVSTTSFHHWRDPAAGLAEMSRVLAPRGHAVLVDLSASWLRLTGHRDRARTPRSVERLLAAAGLRADRREIVYRVGPLPMIRAFIASR